MKKVAQKGRGREGQEDRGEEVQEGNDNERSNNGNKKQQTAASPLAIEDGPEGSRETKAKARPDCCKGEQKTPKKRSFVDWRKEVRFKILR